MTEREHIENAQAAREARDAVVSKPSGPGRTATDEAMRRYLAAEQYHEQQEQPDADEPGRGRSGD
ncbi:hypothetical protein EKO23_05220 [Nocardioides guangzhouensis]|uniref:Uncharacterized protein n=1 Tax=Nocardioides guangzhouensis TaxID=2497878 RepID=A0A4Q4ZJU0_9ACTN|nr:hypothetical protein [Nocardioides guangzhouensis]RYP87786.1 hypothetical protein EKO23_05220 [Nocardioides guangzhouensis]